MKNEKLIKRPDGSRVNISVSLLLENYVNEFKYVVSVSICEPKKRTFHYVNDTDNFTWRNLSWEEKRKYEHNLFLKYVSEDEILQAKMELWEMIKPLKNIV